MVYRPSSSRVKDPRKLSNRLRVCGSIRFPSPSNFPLIPRTSKVVSGVNRAEAVRNERTDFGRSSRDGSNSGPVRVSSCVLQENAVGLL